MSKQKKRKIRTRRSTWRVIHEEYDRKIVKVSIKRKYLNNN